MDVTYLDNNATTRPTPAVAAAVAEATESLWANPSSVHRFGQQVRQRLELARADTARLIGARPRELVFTSGGTESIDLALRGLVESRQRAGAERVTLFHTPAEHAAVQELGDSLRDDDGRGTRVQRLKLRDDGRLDVEELRAALTELRGEAVVSVMWANNETGVISPMAAVAEAVAEARQAGHTVWLHTDATQAVGKLPVDVTTAGVDLLSFAAHKFHGPKGVGGLWLRRGVRLRSQQHGGPQEMERRGGTENVPGILGLGVAATEAAEFVHDTERIAALRALRDRLESQVQAGMKAAGLAQRLGPMINGGGGTQEDYDTRGGEGGRLWNTSNLGFRGLEAEAILLGLSERGVCASAGAACSSGSLDPSPVLRAMGIEEPVAHGSIRMSLSRFTTSAEIDHAAEVLVAVAGRLAKVLPL